MPDDLEGNIPAALAARQAFGASLDRLMTDKVRPSKMPLRWTNETLAEAIGNTPTSISNWRGGKLPDPRNFDRLVTVLFGPTPRILSQDLQDRLSELERLWKAARNFSLRGKRTPTRSKSAVELHGVPSLLPYFVGRDGSLNRIAEFFDGKQQRPWLVLTGMPGIGKTALAAHYFRQPCIPFAEVWWCPAEEREELLSSLGALGNKLGVVRSGDATADTYAKTVLRAPSLQHWCLVYDNVSLLSTIEDLLPTDSTALLITTRTADWSEWPLHRIVVDELPVNEAVRLLEMQAGQSDQAGANDLALAVGCLPLALGHAASTCAQRKITFSNYTTQLKKHIATASLNTRYPKSVFATIKIAMESIPDGELARHLLVMLSFCSPDRIPQVLAELLLANETDEAGSQAILDLITFSLVRSDPYDDGEPAIVVHRVVQEVGRSIARGSGSAQIMADQLALGLWRLFPVASADDHETWPYCEKLFSHVMALWNESELFAEATEMWLDLAVTTARYQRARGHYDSAASIIGFAAEEADRVLPSDSLVRINARLEYAGMLQAEEDVAGAKAIYQEILPVLTSVKGGDDLSVAQCLSNLGALSAREGSYDEAAVFQKKALKIYEKNRIDEFLVAHCLSALGWAQVLSRQFEEAEGSLKRAASMSAGDSRKAKETLASAYDGFAVLHAALKNSDISLDFATKSLTLVEHVFGEGKELSMALKNTGMLFRMQGRHIECQHFLETALEMAERRGPSRFRAELINEIAEHFWDYRDYYRALEITVREMETQVAEFGEFSTHALLMRKNVARSAIHAGEFTEAHYQSQLVLSNEEANELIGDAAVVETAMYCFRALQLLGRNDEADAVWQHFNLESHLEDGVLPI